MDKNSAISVNPEINEMENFVSDETKNIVDVLLALIGMVGAFVALGNQWDRTRLINTVIEIMESL